ncbi:MAG TPA: histidinol dehydrogenase, partial [Dehalococcoidia bacterium]|nr:histidinol dehydrogenase [Dehalococcoidia bacterium]
MNFEGSYRILEDHSSEAEGLVNRDVQLSSQISSKVQLSINATWKEEDRDITPEEHVARIIGEVRDKGDRAVRAYTELFDDSSYMDIEVSQIEFDEAFSRISKQDLKAIEFTVERVRRYHREQLSHGPSSFLKRGTGWIVRPISRVGIYMAGNVAALPSSVIHTAIPAVVAGVEEIVGVSAPMPDGRVNPYKLVAAKLSGIDKVFRASGAQGLAALAYGTDTIEPVDKIFGPGGLFVTLAKQQLFGQVGIDSIYGPTETLVISDESTDPALVASDLLAQAEHDVLATPVLLVTSVNQARKVLEAINEQLPLLERADIAEQAMLRGGAIVVKDIDRAIELANRFAPEHLCLLIADPNSVLEKIKNAGGVFVGENSPEVLGDYTAGPSHVMPTGGSA